MGVNLSIDLFCSCHLSVEKNFSIVYVKLPLVHVRDILIIFNFIFQMETCEFLGEDKPYRFQTLSTWSGTTRKITAKYYTERVKNGVYSPPEGSSIFYEPKSLFMYSTGKSKHHKFDKGLMLCVRWCESFISKKLANWLKSLQNRNWSRQKLRPRLVWNKNHWNALQCIRIKVNLICKCIYLLNYSFLIP